MRISAGRAKLTGAWDATPATPRSRSPRIPHGERGLAVRILMSVLRTCAQQGRDRVEVLWPLAP